MDLHPPKITVGLANEARCHSADMAQDDYFRHDTYDRVEDELLCTCSTWDQIATYSNGALGESIAAGYSDPQTVMNTWLDSLKHSSSILNEGS